MPSLFLSIHLKKCLKMAIESKRKVREVKAKEKAGHQL
jgi:hypothetical protein